MTDKKGRMSDLAPKFGGEGGSATLKKTADK